MSHEKFMMRAIELSRQKMNEGEGGPFAAVVVKEGEIVGEGWNMVTSHNDPTSHAEITAIRAACDRLGTFSLQGSTLYTSCEPCPMCLAAIYWARIDKVFYANTTEDAAGIGFDDGFLYKELALPAAERSMHSERLLANEARKVFEEWEAKPDKVRY